MAKDKKGRKGILIYEIHHENKKKFSSHFACLFFINMQHNLSYDVCKET